MIWAAAGRAQAPEKSGSSLWGDQFFVRRAYSAGSGHRRRTSLLPFGRRWREAPDEGSAPRRFASGRAAGLSPPVQTVVAVASPASALERLDRAA
jgi:hypothetical protein